MDRLTGVRVGFLAERRKPFPRGYQVALLQIG